MEGRLCRVEPLDAEAHSGQLYEAHANDTEGRNWTYLPYGPFASVDEVQAWALSVEKGEDPLFLAIVDLATQKAVGWASYLRIDAEMGSIEVGHVAYSPLLQLTAAGTEAMYLMMRRAFEELGYRRYEWKCDSLNAPSWNAAERLGFTYEGTFRQAWVRRGRNRDNAWFSIIDSEWPAIRGALEAWLDPANFDTQGRQRKRLAELMAEWRRLLATDER
jgi:RimJ/RimL family protein N-acetyltransferase